MGGVSLINYVPKKLFGSTFYIAFRFSGECNGVFMYGRSTQHPYIPLWTYTCTSSKLTVRYCEIDRIAILSTYWQAAFRVMSMTFDNLFTIFWKEITGHLVGSLYCTFVNVFRHACGTWECNHPPKSSNGMMQDQGERT